MAVPWHIIEPYRLEDAMNLEIPAAASQEIAEHIQSAESPVGIDAKKTHVLILHKLIEIERRLDRLEARLPLDR